MTSSDDIGVDAALAFAERLAEAAAAEVMPRVRGGIAVDNKARRGFDPATEADREAERVQRELIVAHHPHHGILGEEFGTQHPSAQWRWVLDPIDGTRAFICGIHSWTTLIALERDAQPFVSVIDQPYTGERWLGSLEETTFRGPGGIRPARTSGCTELSRVRLSTTDPRATGYFTADEVTRFDRLAASTAVARFSLDAYAYALLSVGELDVVMESGLAHYDYAALAPVIRGAGGVITDWSGDAFSAEAGGRTLAAATPELHAAALRALNDG